MKQADRDALCNQLLTMINDLDDRINREARESGWLSSTVTRLVRTRGYLRRARHEAQIIPTLRKEPDAPR